MIRKILCFLGFHDDEFCIYVTNHGGRMGDKCIHCGTWSKDSIFIEKEEGWLA